MFFVHVVIVMSTKLFRGSTPADHLSGGDYDGDKAFVSWDKRLTNHIQPLTTPPMEKPEGWATVSAGTLDNRLSMSL